MTNNDKKNSLSYMIFIMVGLAVISATVLAYTSYITKQPIKNAKDNLEKAAINAVLTEDFDNNPFEERTTINTADGKGKLELYPARLDGVVNAVAIKTYSNDGFSGKIELIVGFAMDGTVNAYKVINHQETPGLGTKAMESPFTDQFYGVKPNTNSFGVKQDGGEIDAVTSATITSRAVIDAIKRAHEAYSKFITKG